MKTTPASRIYILGATLFLALTMCSRDFGDRGGPYFMTFLTIAGVAYLLAVREFFATSTFPRNVLVIALVLSGLWQVEFLRLRPGADDDIHRYVWDGRLQRLGYNPYIVVPSDPGAKELHTVETRNLNNPDLPSPYPPAAQLFFRAVTAIHESTFALKVAFVICDLVIVFLLLDVLRRTRKPEHLVLVYAWNPLLAIEVAGSGHIDIVGALLLLLSASALVRRWRATAAVALGLAILVKFVPLVLIPFYWKRVRIRDAALSICIAGILLLPFLYHGRVPIGSLGTYVRSFRFNGPVFAVLDRVAPPQLISALAVLAGLVTATWLMRTEREWSTDLFVWPMAAFLFCAPVVYPWYLFWLLPFLTSASTLPIVVWTVSIVPTYIMWHLRTVRGVWGPLPGWVMPVEYGCVAIAAAGIASQWRGRLPTVVAQQTSRVFPPRQS